MKKISLITLFIILFLGCGTSNKEYFFTVPTHEKRDIKVTQEDLDILYKAKALLHDEAIWDKDDVRLYQESHKLTLFCALRKASVDVLGIYIHRRAALQEVRFIIEETYHDRVKKHRLVDFNAHPKTSYRDILFVLDSAIAIVYKKLEV